MTAIDPPPPAAAAPSRGGLERASLWLVGLGLAVIVSVTFITSFDAVSAVAVSRRAVSPHLSWAVPLAIDGLIVVGSAAAWVESLRGGRWWSHLFPVLIVAAAGALSVAANVAHAPTTDPLARVLAGVPPVALLSAVELGAWLIRRDVRRTAVGPATPVVAGVSPQTPALSPGDTQETASARERIVAALREHVDAGREPEQVSARELARAARVNRSTVYKHLQGALESVSSNGDGA